MLLAQMLIDTCMNSLLLMLGLRNFEASVNLDQADTGKCGTGAQRRGPDASVTYYCCRLGMSGFYCQVMTEAMGRADPDWKGVQGEERRRPRTRPEDLQHPWLDGAA